MAYKTIISDGYFFTNKTVRLHAASFTNDSTLLNFYERPHKTIIADTAPIEIAGLYTGNLASKLHISYASLPKGWVHKL
jgi:hypothetical protein